MLLLASERPVQVRVLPHPYMGKPGLEWASVISLPNGDKNHSLWGLLQRG